MLSSYATFLSFTAVTETVKAQTECSANQVSYINELLILNRIIEFKLSRFPTGICGSCSGILSVFAVGGFHRIPNTLVDFRFLQNPSKSERGLPVLPLFYCRRYCMKCEGSTPLPPTSKTWFIYLDKFIKVCLRFLFRSIYGVSTSKPSMYQQTKRVNLPTF